MTEERECWLDLAAGIQPMWHGEANEIWRTMSEDQIISLCEAVAASEREACAKMCEVWPQQKSAMGVASELSFRFLSEAMRQRGKP